MGINDAIKKVREISGRGSKSVKLMEELQKFEEKKSGKVKRIFIEEKLQGHS